MHVEVKKLYSCYNIVILKTIILSQYFCIMMLIFEAIKNYFDPLYFTLTTVSKLLKLFSENLVYESLLVV